MNRSNHYEDEELLLPDGGNHSASEPWQPTNTPLQGASGYNDRNYIPLSSEVDRKIQGTGGYGEDSGQKPKDHYSHVQKNGPNDDDDELLVPPAEDYRRSRWDMGSNPYQNPRFYDDAMLNASHFYPPQSSAMSPGYPPQSSAMSPGYPPQSSAMSPGYPLQSSALSPGYPLQSSAMNSSVSNNVVVVQPGQSTATIYTTEHVRDYTVLSIFTLLCCCLPLGICALVQARDAHNFIMIDKRREALAKSRSSRNLNIAGIIIGPILAAVMILLIWIIKN